jgi:N-acetylglucosamine malate deacetylase 1
MKKFDRVLVLSPHTDDGELGCGGSMARFIEEATNVYYASFSIAEKSVPSKFSKNILETEVKQALKIIGIPASNIWLYHYAVRTFTYFRQEILENIVSLRDQLDPELVFIPSTNDLHQDHKVIAEEGIRAFKHSNVLAYEQPWNNIHFATTGFISLGQSHVSTKIDALNCYRSQENRTYFNRDFILGLAKVRGVQVGVEFAEAFEVVRWSIR